MIELLVIITMLTPVFFAPESYQGSFEHQFGAAKQVSTPLKIEQDGQPDIELTADYETKSFEIPPASSGMVYAITNQNDVEPLFVYGHQITLNKIALDYR